MPDETNNDTEDGRTHSPTDGQGKLMGGDGTGRERVHTTLLDRSIKF